MSKKRNRHQSLSALFNQTIASRSTQAKPVFGATMSKSFFIPKKNSQKSYKPDITDFLKQRVFNKNISFFRQTSKQNDPGMLHFQSSLRQTKTLNHDFSKTTQTRPFSVSQKRTMNQVIAKRIFDAKAKQSRVSTAYYRWHNRTGKNTTNCVQFECSLRDYEQGMNPQQTGFSNYIKPIKYQKVEPKLYEEAELFCSKQRKLFRLKGR